MGRPSNAVHHHRSRGVSADKVNIRFARESCCVGEKYNLMLFAAQAGELLHHALIDRALEGHDQLGEILHRLPAPVDELRLVTAAARTRDVDLGILAGEAHGKPFLSLAAVAALPGAPG